MVCGYKTKESWDEWRNPPPQENTSKGKSENDTVYGDKIINYGTFINNETIRDNKISNVSDEKIKDFFLRVQLSLSEKRKSLTKDKLPSLPTYLKVPYDMNVVISDIHGVGYEFITPSDNPEINISRTQMPIEQYYFSRYTTREDYSKTTAMIIGVKYLVLKNIQIIGGKKIIAVQNDANVLLRDVLITYSDKDVPKVIPFLRILGNNQKGYWDNMNPVDEASYLFGVH